MTTRKSPVDRLLEEFLDENIREHWAVKYLSEKQKEAYTAGAKDFASMMKLHLGRICLEKLK